MVIECTECHTRFKLADDKLKPGGTKVRCSKCKQTFTVMPPAPEPPHANAPEEEIDFGEFNMERLTGQEPEITAAPPSALPAAVPGSFFEEEAEGKPASEAAEESPSEGNAFGDDTMIQDSSVGPGAFDELSFGLDEGPEKEGVASGEFTFDEGGEASDEFSLGAEEPSSPAEFSFHEEENDAEADGNGFGFESDELSFDEEKAEEKEFSFNRTETTGSVEFAFDEGENGAEAGTAFSWDSEESEGDEGFDFGEGARSSDEKDEFDFSGITFGEEESTPAAPAAEERIAPAAPQPVMIETETIDSPRQTAEPPRAPAKPRPEFNVPPPAARRHKSPLKGLVYFMMVLLLAMAGGVIYFYWQGGIPELTHLIDRVTGQAPQAEVSGQIRIEELSSFYVANQGSGQMLAIQGQAVNGYPQARSSITVKGVLFSKDGKPLLQQTVFCGNPLDQAELKKLPFAKIEERMNNPFGESLSNLNVAPGKAIPFTIVFRNLPANIAEFTVEAADSKPGTKQ